MRLLWTKSTLPAGPLICWGLEEPVSHFAIEFFDSIILQSNFFGVHVLHKKDFDKHSIEVYAKRLDMDFTGEAVLLATIMQKYYGAKYDWKWFFNMCFNVVKKKLFRIKHNDEIRWRSRDKFLCTEVVEFMEPFLGKIDVGNGSPYKLALKLGAYTKEK